ncbi:hypothetical protein M9H77_00854 [Catharanthus roseus]|uniref:Uncharacterized protein n=1 Tax=Catharanthus roseus TaxID=4058 RepID=A0ACC0C3V3_CATRO|nr:hypothetical protein M9H77_00854 [Catharanthus roseus]
MAKLLNYSSFLIFFLIIAAAAMAQYQNHHEPIEIKGPGILPTKCSDKDIMKCWKVLIRTDGCITQIYEAIFQQKFDQIGPICCENIMNLKDNCWPRIFPFHPQFPPFLKNYCAKFGKYERDYWLLNHHS